MGLPPLKVQYRLLQRGALQMPRPAAGEGPGQTRRSLEPQLSSGSD